MPRGREFDDREVIDAAKEEFWERGYPGTSISDIQRRTGLNRSSLYLAFGPAATFGVWLSSRIDARNAADLCDVMTAEVESWRISPRAKTRTTRPR